MRGIMDIFTFFHALLYVQTKTILAERNERNFSFDVLKSAETQILSVLSIKT